MPDKLTQQNRIAKLNTPLGQDVLVLTRFHVTEGLSELFDISVDALSETGNLDFDAVIGNACTITHETFDKVQRVFNGVAVAAEWNGRFNEYYAYRLTLRPWLWLLGHVSDCRIFHEKSVLDIIKAVFSSRGFSDFRDATTSSYQPIEYVVQYRETDLNFVCRLMEQFGIYYFFEHQDGKHTLVLADAKSSHKDVPDLSKVPFKPQTGESRYDCQRIESWTSARQFRTGQSTLNDYNFKTPAASQLADKSKPGNYSHGSFEFYDYPGKYLTADEGGGVANVRIDAEQAQDHRRFAAGDAPSLLSGGLVSLQDHPTSDENTEYLTVRCMHSVEGQSFRTGGGAGSDTYSGAYEFLPSAKPFRAPAVTPRPIVHGPQTAVVTGSGEIDVDEYGRILVRFFWDRDKGKSCRVRVAQVWAGKTWGGQVIPRVGQEVVVEFLEGDPDRPLVTGAVYNADNMPPYAMPDNKTQAGVKSNSSEGGGGYNEFMFEDKKGEEFIRMHGEKDHQVVIKNSETVTIGEIFSPSVGSPSRTHLLSNGDDKLTVQAGNQDVVIGNNQTLKVTTDRTKTVGGNENASVTGNESLTVQGQISVTGSTTIQITANTSIMLSVGGSSITIDPSGVTIKGNMVTVNGSGITMIQGGMVMIN